MAKQKPKKLQSRRETPEAERLRGRGSYHAKQLQAGRRLQKQKQTKRKMTNGEAGTGKYRTRMAKVATRGKMSSQARKIQPCEKLERKKPLAEHRNRKLQHAKTGCRSNAQICPPWTRHNGGIIEK